MHRTHLSDYKASLSHSTNSSSLASCLIYARTLPAHPYSI